MTITKLNPYLNFNGTAAEAIALYERALGAKSGTVMRFGDMPDMKIPDDQKERVMHAALEIGAGVVMISDAMGDTIVPLGGNVQVSLDFDDVADMTTKFDALAVGGKVAFPLHDAFWGAKFGMLTDAFGIEWMFSCTQKPA